METFLDILKFTIPGAIVFATAYYSIKLFLNNDANRRTDEIKTATQKITTPIRVQAYERLVLFLERINPESLLIRVQHPDMTSGQLHHDLLVTVRAEFEHNLSQQIYVSAQTWLAVKRAKEMLTTIINEEASKLSPIAPANALSQAILQQQVLSNSNNHIQIAIDMLKLEAGSFI